MCGRYSMYEPMAQYLRELAPHQQVISYVDPEPVNRYNIALSTRVPVIRRDERGLHIEPVRWGWELFWAMGKRPPSINARSETVATSKFFKQLWRQGRVLVPANGWFEWVKDSDDPKKKQPYYIRLQNEEPMFFAGLAQVHPGLEPHDGDSCVIITDASDAGMVDVHDRRPVVLGSEAAREWLEPGLSSQQAQELARSAGRPVADFTWYPVARSVGNVKNHGPELIEPAAVG